LRRFVYLDDDAVDLIAKGIAFRFGVVNEGEDFVDVLRTVVVWISPEARGLESFKRAWCWVGFRNSPRWASSPWRRKYA
jgi:hypothetical protein